MTGRLGLTALVVAAAAVPVSNAVSAPIGRRPPPSVGLFCATQFDGRFVGSRPGERTSGVHLCPGDSDMLVTVWGAVPATCRERADLGGALVGPDTGVTVDFNTFPRAPIGAVGGFAVSARSPQRGLGLPKATVRISGMFDGRTVEGRVTLTTRAWWRYAHCVADARFRAKLAEP